MSAPTSGVRESREDLSPGLHARIPQRPPGRPPMSERAPTSGGIRPNGSSTSPESPQIGEHSATLTFLWPSGGRQTRTHASSGVVAMPSVFLCWPMLRMWFGLDSCHSRNNACRNSSHKLFPSPLGFEYTSPNSMLTPSGNVATFETQLPLVCWAGGVDERHPRLADTERSTPTWLKWPNTVRTHPMAFRSHTQFGRAGPNLPSPPRCGRSTPWRIASGSARPKKGSIACEHARLGTQHSMVARGHRRIRSHGHMYSERHQSTH